MFSVSRSGAVFYCPDAFTEEDGQTILDRVGPSRCIPVSLEEATHFACNTVVIGDTAISPTSPRSFADKVERAGLRSVSVDLSEFMKAGGAAKCLILQLTRVPSGSGRRR
jgi:N-dimethylarginine dimethylaminohydrolase